MNKGKVKIGMTQFHCVPDRSENMKKAEEQIREMAAKGAKIICTQELFNGLYFPQTIDYTKRRLGRTCRRTNQSEDDCPCKRT